MSVLGRLAHADLWYRAWRYRFKVEPAELRFVASELNPGDVAVDVGAHKGAYTWWMWRAVGPSGRVFSFEPQPELAARLRRAVSALGWSGVSVEAAGVSSAPGVLKLHVPGEGPSPGASFEPKADAVRTVEVSVITLDERMADVPRVAFIKCDVEGHELEVFRGAEHILRTHQPTLLFECEPRHRGGSTREVFEYLEGLGYRGAFFLNGKLVDLAELDPELHQREGAVPYVNNFVFVPAARSLW